MPFPFNSDVRTSQNVTSLNYDGSLKWFIPPYVIPFVILALVAARALWLS
jgi:hypothetical protein